MTGFEFLKTLSNPPSIIVTTAYQEFALEGYELDIIDYLLKPFSFARFLKAINKATKLTTTSVPSTTTAALSKNQRFFLKGNKKHHQIHTEEVLFIEAQGNYTKVYLQEEMILSHEKISSFEIFLPKADFLRVHKSFIVATTKIKLIEGNRIFIGVHKIPIGQTYRSVVSGLFDGKF